MPSVTPTRRDFLKTAAAGTTAVAMTARSYGRLRGANERIGIGVIGCGRRGFGAHMSAANKHSQDQNLEITAVCDVWAKHRQRAVETAKDWFGSGNRSIVYGTEGVMELGGRPTVLGKGSFGKSRIKEPIQAETVPCPDHFLNWFQCLRSREQPAAPIEAGYEHSVACIMADRALQTGHRQIYDAENDEIRPG